MIGGGEFIINGAERVVVSQLHRSPGVDFVIEIEARRPQAARAAASFPSAAAGSSSTSPRRTALGVRIDQSGKFSAMTLLRAMDPKYSTERRPAPRVLRDDASRRSSTAAASPRSKARSPSTTSSIRPSSERAGEIIVECGPEDHQERRPRSICTSGVKQRRGDGRRRRSR